MGTEVLAEVLDQWATFDVHALAERLNEIPQLDVKVAGVTIRAFHLRSQTDDALPIVLTHGWPSTVLEPLALADRLAHPTSYGADASDSFHVVVPGLPGFPLSTAPDALEDYTAAHTADLWAGLMQALGYSHFVASAGDIGARVSAWLGARHPDRVLGLHLSPNALAAPAVGLSALETDWVTRQAAWDRSEGGYAQLQQTKPLSLAHALTDSPAGLAAWILEKWRGWGDGADAVLEHYDPQELLGHLSLYWLTNSIATSLIPYVVHDHPPGARPAAMSVEVPVCFYLAPAEDAAALGRGFDRQAAGGSRGSSAAGVILTGCAADGCATGGGAGSRAGVVGR
jgi:pimeloyl-ACP methyl ester carboxylesterase